MNSAVKTLVLLAMISSARAMCAPVEISASTASAMSIRSYTVPHYTALYSAYAEDVTVFCTSSSAANLTIKHEGQSLHAVRNSSRIKLDIKKPNIGQYSYDCGDDESGCADRLFLQVQPAMSVYSPRVQIGYIDTKLVHFIPLGDNIEIFCSSNESESIQITYVDSDNLRITERAELVVLNQTTVKTKSCAEVPRKRRYYCSSKGIYAHVILLFNYLPEAQNFQCISYHKRKLECSWNSLDKNNEFKLYYDHRDYMRREFETVLLCSNMVGEMTGLCRWDFSIKTVYGKYHLETDTSFHLLLQTCNEVACHNQTFTLKHSRILKLSPPTNLRITNTTSKDIIITWHHDEFWWEYPKYKLKYRPLGADWQQVNITSSPCDPLSGDCKFRLNLECPDSHYEVMVYAKSTGATEDKFWSEPAYISFFTKRSAAAVIDPTCTAKFDERKPLPSAEGMMFEVRQLIQYDRKKESKLLRRVSTLTEKLDVIEELKNLLNGSSV